MSEKVLCDKEDLTAIADAIRTSTGSSETFNVPELSTMASRMIASGGGTVEVDATLTQEGMAADAKAVGDAIGALSEEILALDLNKVSFPVNEGGVDTGTAGQFAVSDGKGGIVWKTLVEAEGVSY